jgi:hypothetical protein
LLWKSKCVVLFFENTNRLEGGRPDVLAVGPLDARMAK